MRKTITTIFMVPTLQIPKGALRLLGFINAYQQDMDRDMDYGKDKVIYLLFKPEDTDYFREFLDAEYERTDLIVEDYDYPDGYIVLIYKLRESFKRDYARVKKGQYSKTTPAFQKLFPKVIKLMKGGLHRDEISLQYRVFNKTPDLIEFWEKKLGMEFTDDMEVWSGWEESKEILNIMDIKNQKDEKNSRKVTKKTS